MNGLSSEDADECFWDDFDIPTEKMIVKMHNDLFDKIQGNIAEDWAKVDKALKVVEPEPEPKPPQKTTFFGCSLAKQMIKPRVQMERPREPTKRIV